jgi:Transcription initiation factor IID, 31kD subunit
MYGLHFYCDVLVLYVGLKLLMDVARHKNSIPLPLIKPFSGPKLPPDRYCLTAANYRLKAGKKVYFLLVLLLYVSKLRMCKYLGCCICSCTEDMTIKSVCEHFHLEFKTFS